MDGKYVTTTTLTKYWIQPKNLYLDGRNEQGDHEKATRRLLGGVQRDAGGAQGLGLAVHCVHSPAPAREQAHQHTDKLEMEYVSD